LGRKEKEEEEGRQKRAEQSRAPTHTHTQTNTQHAPRIGLPPTQQRVRLVLHCITLDWWVLVLDGTEGTTPAQRAAWNLSCRPRSKHQRQQWHCTPRQGTASWVCVSPISRKIKLCVGREKKYVGSTNHPLPYPTPLEGYPKLLLHLEKLESEAQYYWERFYQRNTNKFWKDRHWLLREFSELIIGNSNNNSNANNDTSISGDESQRKSPQPQSGRRKLVRALELGCGVGNTIFPLQEKLPELHCVGVDFSDTAIRLLKENPLFRPDRCEGYVVDIVHDNLQQKTSIPNGTIDVALLIFVLSAIAPEHYDRILSDLVRLMAPGGYILFRDYGNGDAAQKQFEESGSKRLNESATFFVRDDGTRAYFFDTDLIETLAARHNLEVIENIFVRRQIENKKMSKVMDRCWIQAKLRLK
jgi:SAM-dependent methyltransferase